MGNSVVERCANAAGETFWVSYVSVHSLSRPSAERTRHYNQYS
jgi:hypothetical protein